MNTGKKFQQTDLTRDKALKRHVSVDVLRGFDMFWIVGGSGFFLAIFRLLGGPFDKYLSPHMDHVVWEGFYFFDLIFPLFEFIMGMSVVFSLQKLLSAQGKKTAYAKVLKRSLILYLLGIIYYGGIAEGVEHIRLMGVLQRLALTYLFTSILYIHLRLRGLIIVCITILLGYWILISFVPVPGFGETSFAEGRNWANWVDINFLPLFKWDGAWDPEGLLGTIPATVSCILGVFASLLLIKENLDEMKKVYYFIGGGIALVVLGYLWGIQFPIIKKIWTSSYVLVAGGYSFILMGVLYLILDILKIQKWALPLVWLGMNPIGIYMIWNVLNFNHLAHRFAGLKEYYTFSEDIGFLCGTTVALALVLALVRFLYNKRIFFRL
jgi:predicted acyltransferase